MIYKNVEITDTAYGGYGVAKVDGGFTVFIPQTVEGDVVDFEIFEKKKTHSFAKLIKIHKPSKLRREFPCKFFNECGGCQFGHIDYDYQIEIKKRLISNFFRKVEGFKIDSVITSPEFRYRFRATFRLKNGKFGFLGFKSNKFIPITDCLICKETVVEKISKIANKYKGSEINKCYIIENEKGEALLNTDIELENLEDFKDIIGLKTKNKILGYSLLKIDVADFYYYVGFDSFSQSNRFLLREFAEVVVNFVDENDLVLELYAGSGFFTHKVAKKAKAVLAIEENREAIGLLKKLNVENVDLIGSKAENIKRIDINPYNTLLVDPPRTGLSKPLIDAISNRFEKIIYVSCNPSTMARDILRLSNNYDLKKYLFIDMFPNTYHIESIALLKRKEG